MSEDSPWGAPPPSPNYGPPPGSYPTGPTQPPPNVPGSVPGGQWGAPPPSYGGGPQGPYGHPPRKRSTGAIIAAVLGVVVVAAAIVVTLVVKGGGDDETATDGTSTSATSDSPQTSDAPETSDTPETSTTPETSSAPPIDVPAGAVEGQKGGYYFELPGAAWNDAFDEASKEGLGATLDSFIILGTSIPNAQSNILAEALAAPFASAPEDLEEQWKRNLSGGDDAVPKDVPDITIDGEHAIGVKFTNRVNDQDIMFNQRAYLVLHDGQQYSILLSYPSSGDFVSEDDFDTMLASWRWLS